MNVAGGEGRLISKVYAASDKGTDGCIKFWYRIHGKDSRAGSLQVIKKKIIAVLTKFLFMGCFKKLRSFFFKHALTGVFEKIGRPGQRDATLGDANDPG